MKTSLTVTLALLIGSTVYGQSRYEEFKKLNADKDTLGQRILLQKWEWENSNEAELYTCYFNYCVQKCMTELIRLDSEPRSGKNLQVTDSAKKVVGYIHGETSYNPKYLKLGFDIIERV